MLTPFRVASAILVHVERDWLDYATFWVALVAATITLLAVLVALFGPDFRRWRRRPRLTLTVDPYREFIYGLSGGANPLVEDGMFLTIENASDRDAGQGVEVLLSVARAEPNESWDDPPDTDTGLKAPEPYIRDVNLNYDSGLNSSQGRYTIAVPPGICRRIYLANLGEPWEIAKRRSRVPPSRRPAEPTDYCGAWATWPPKQDGPSWIEPDQRYRLSLTLAGLNFNAKRYRGEIVADVQELPAGSIPAVDKAFSVEIKWSEPLTDK